MTITETLDLRVGDGGSKEETYDLNKLLLKLKHQIKGDYHLIRSLGDDDKINFLLRYYPRNKIYKEESGD